MKRFVSILLLLSILLSGCSAQAEAEKTKYNATFLTLFDTVTSIVGYAENEEAFREMTQAVHDELLVYHQLFDIYTNRTVYYLGLCSCLLLFRSSLCGLGCLCSCTLGSCCLNLLFYHFFLRHNNFFCLDFGHINGIHFGHRHNCLLYCF